MNNSIAITLYQNFLGDSPRWYKNTILLFLLINPIIYTISPFVAGWLLIAQFIMTLAMALSCYPLLPGGLLALQAIILGMTSPDTVLHEVLANFEVILLLIFMVAGIYFMRDLLLYVFTKILLNIKSKYIISLLFSFVAAFLSAFLDALTVTAVLITVFVGFYKVYHQVISDEADYEHHDASVDSKIPTEKLETLHQFQAFLRSLMMHGAVGTALGGVCTIVGEPQNLLIAHKMDWTFMQFFYKMAPVSIPVLIAGLVTCVLVEKFSLFGYGTQIPPSVANILREQQQHREMSRTLADKTALVSQAIIAIILIFSLAFHLASVGLIGLMIIVLLTTFNGVNKEHHIGHAFQEALPFTALLVVFFSVVAVIHDLHLFAPITNWVFSQPIDMQPLMFFIANALLSVISDNVFVATVYINQVSEAFNNGLFNREHFDNLAIAINTGTNIPSVATPNGQAAFLFLLTSALAPLIKLSYWRMVIMAFPYTIILSATAIVFLIITI